jgi:hypothetical protein
VTESGRQTVYVKLLDEGVHVWRPVDAAALPDGTYRLEATGDYDPELETWEFLPGSDVRCELRHLSGGPALVAVSEA